jgi:hypothetical protein
MESTERGARILELTPQGGVSGAPAEVLVASSGPNARERVLEFFAARIRNGHTRRAYGHAVRCFLGFCAARGVRRLQDVDPVAVAAYIVSHTGSEPTRKLHLAGIRHLFDWLVTGQVVTGEPGSLGPGASARGGRRGDTRPSM